MLIYEMIINLNCGLEIEIYEDHRSDYISTFKKELKEET